MKRRTLFGFLSALFPGAAAARPGLMSREQAVAIVQHHDDNEDKYLEAGFQEEAIANGQQTPGLPAHAGA